MSDGSAGVVVVVLGAATVVVVVSGALRGVVGVGCPAEGA
jgi:hypothetical protein